MPPPWHGQNSYCSTELAPYWQYAIGQDFQRGGVPASYATNHPQTWYADEVDKIEFAKPVSSISLNADHTLLACAVAEDIHIFATSDRRPVRVLRGSQCDIEAVKWSPTEPHVLMSYTSYFNRRLRSSCTPQILIWNIDDQATNGGLDPTTIERLSHQAILNLDQDILDLAPPTDWSLSATERNSLATTLATSLQKLASERLIRKCTKIDGVLLSSHETTPFSPEGRSFLLQQWTGSRPRSNSNVPWDLSIYDRELRRIRCTLTGHTDKIVWASFSPSGMLVGAASWDGTFRIWHSADGSRKYVFDMPNSKQNWTAGFSPDGELFAGATGAGEFYVWDLRTGALTASFVFGDLPHRWCRTLAWSPDSKYLAVGGQSMATIMVVDPRAPESRRIIQHRHLSAHECEEAVQPHMKNFLETTSLCFLHDGRLAFKMSGDRGVEVYDFEKNEKLRFAPPPTEEEQSGGWGGFLYCPGEGLIASSDDGELDRVAMQAKNSVVRFWRV